MRRLLRGGAAGQAAVETAIVLPLFTFMIMGILQMTLVYQARSMLKYGAYRAVRAGAMNNACIDKMEDAALAALVPVIAYGDSYLKAGSAGQYIGSLMRVKMIKRYPTGLPIVDVRICGPLSGMVRGGSFVNGSEIDFDDARNNYGTGGVRSFERTKLRIQVKYLQHLVIPLANAVIFRAWTGQRISDVMRMNDQSFGPNSNRVLSFDEGGKNNRRPHAEDTMWLSMAAQMGQYYLPLYANYGFRMQSNFFLSNCPLPARNECWHYRDGAAGAY